MPDIILEILDSVDVQTNAAGKKALADLLSYDKEFWKQGQYKKEKQKYKKSIITGRSGKYFFHTGLLERVIQFLKDRKKYFILRGEENISHIEHCPPKLEGIEFRPEQKRQLRAAFNKGRGVLKAATGIGKTVIAGGIVSAYPGSDILVLAHTNDLVEQMADELIKFGIDDVGVWNSNRKDESRVLVSTIQSFKNLDPASYVDVFDVVLVDEGHHITSENGMYGTVLKQMLTPCRFAVTATLPTKKEALFALEGLIGPVIDEITIQEGYELGRLALPKIRIVKMPTSDKIRAMKKYPEIYRYGVVLRKVRNRRIAEIAKEYAEEGKTVLINVVQIDHAYFIQKHCKSLGVKAEVVEGATDDHERRKVKKALNSGKLKVAIATTVWSEGINIPGLNVVINAAGGKSEIRTLQVIGRGLRKTDDKETVTIVDIFDPCHPHLISHFGERVSLYCDEGWL